MHLLVSMCMYPLSHPLSIIFSWPPLTAPARCLSRGSRTTSTGVMCYRGRERRFLGDRVREYTIWLIELAAYCEDVVRIIINGDVVRICDVFQHGIHLLV